MQLEGRNAIVTGAADGIGPAIVTTLIERGAHVLAVDIAGTRLANAHRGRRNVHCLSQDVAAPGASERCVQTVHRHRYLPRGAGERPGASRLLGQQDLPRASWSTDGYSERHRVPRPR